MSKDFFLQQDIQHPYNRARINNRDTAELIGICRGILCDGVLVEEEAIFLLQWLEERPHLLTLWPTNELHEKLSTSMQDGVLDQDSEKILIETLSKLTGMGQREDDTQASTTLPLDDPLPDIAFENCGFCFTGSFDNHTRKECEQLVVERGGFTRKDPSRNIHYLIIGNKSTAAWTQSSFGRKIQKAMTLKQAGHPIAIISESHWLGFFDNE